MKKVNGITTRFISGLLALVFTLAGQATAATLSSISVTPNNPTINVGQTQPFTATGTFSDGATLGLNTAPVVATAAGVLHTCALLSNGTVQCWGSNGRGQLGDGTTTQSTTPVTVSGITNATAIAAGAGHSCAVLATGTVQCWGWNSYGQLGNGTTTDSPTPTPVTVSGITNATAISAGGIYTCAMLASGTVQCWGFKGSGQLGDGSTTGGIA